MPPAPVQRRLWDSGVPLYLAYDIVFGIPASWGTVGEVRNDIDFDTEVLAKLGPELSNIANFPKFEFIRLVAKIPAAVSVPPPPPAFYPGWALTDFFSSLRRAPNYSVALVVHLCRTWIRATTSQAQRKLTLPA